MQPSLSLIIPTIGRSTLQLVMNDALVQMRKGDSIIVVHDPVHSQLDWETEVDSTRAPGVSVWTYQLKEPAGDYGCTACDFGIEKAFGDFIFFIGDDDRIPAGALDLIRAGVAQDLDFPHLFAMEHTGRILQGSLECGQVSGQQIVVPRDMSKMPKMVDFPPHQVAISDYYFVKAVEKAWGRIVMRPEVIAVLPVMNQGRML